MTPEDYQAERTRRGLTQTALAEILGLPQSTISAREHGNRVITKEAMLAIRSLPVLRKIRSSNVKLTKTANHDT